ncbi:hypothetical protein [Streptomyces sp. NPDC045470]|uniref:hypothetical protein n=1 Tax=unclassified Streptomyces TaxID=2593676 RepID=UPI0033E7D901
MRTSRTDVRTDATAATPPERTWPSRGPTEYDSSSMSAGRSRGSLRPGVARALPDAVQRRLLGVVRSGVDARCPEGGFPVLRAPW